MNTYKLGLTWVISLFFCISAFGDGNKALLQTMPEAGPDAIIWSNHPDTQEPEIRVRATDAFGKFTGYYVVLSGQYFNKGSNLILNGDKVKINTDGKFVVEVPIESNRQEFVIKSISPRGKTFSHRAELLVASWPPIHLKYTARRYSVTPYLGISSMSYRQSGLPDFLQRGLNLQLSGDYQLRPGYWFLKANSHLLLLPFNKNIAGQTIRVFGLGLNLGYELLRKPSRWKAKVMGGYSYLSSFSSNKSFGFGNVGGPQIGPAFEYTLSKKSILGGYFKYSLIVNGHSIMPLANSEYATGAEYTMLQSKSFNRIKIALDYSFMSLHLNHAAVYLSTFSLSAGYQF